jgi:hypothetical protein
MSQKRRYWKRNQNTNAYLQFSQAKNHYFQEIKTAKQKCWNDFLENADSEQVYKAYKYCKQKKLEKTPIFCYDNNQKATSFKDKCEILLNTLLPANSNNINADFSAMNETN